MDDNKREALERLRAKGFRFIDWEASVLNDVGTIVFKLPGDDDVWESSYEDLDTLFSEGEE
ncbi:hypothetical protein IKF88_00515 [Candidatus Saccharibacteria bacterium]|nr:hypothetical protein [Candidatus Saccharibacteria bacterium]